MRTMSPKYISPLGRKTKRSNIPMEEEEEEKGPKTVIRLIYLGEKNNKKYRNNEYNYIKFSFSNKISLKNLPNTIIQREEFDINSDKIWIVDKIELGNAKEKKNFLASIYINKVNTIYIDLTPKKNSYYFEFIFYSKTIQHLPKYMNSQYNEKLKEFDDYGLKYRKKMCVINTDIAIAKDFIEDLDLDPSSYKICVRIKKNGLKSSAVHELKLEKKINLPKSDMKGNIPDILKIFQLFDDIKGNKSYDYIQNTYKDLNNGNFRQFLKDYEYSEKVYSDIPDINNDDANIFKEQLLKLIINFFFVDNEDIYRQCKQYILKIIENILGIIWDIENYAKYTKNRALFRYRLYRATAYNLYIIIKKFPENKEKYLKTCLNSLLKYNQEIIDLKSVENDNPYHKAVEFLKKIALNLDEKSSLFDILFQYNSGISQDIILTNKKGDKNRREITQYELSMITVDELKNHIIKILPKFIIKYIYDNNVYSFYSSYNDIIFVNELKTFKNNDLNCNYSSGGYTVPLVVLLLHECWGHAKVSLSSKGRNSPTHSYLRNEDFEENVYELQIGKKRKKVKGESGFEIEFLITGERDTKNMYANYLLSSNDIDNETLLDINLWTKSDFKKLRSLILKNIKEFSPSDIQRYFIKTREDETEGDRGLYMMETYFIDGVEIGPLFKI